MINLISLFLLDNKTENSNDENSQNRHGHSHIHDHLILNNSIKIENSESILIKYFYEYKLVISSNKKINFKNIF